MFHSNPKKEKNPFFKKTTPEQLAESFCPYKNKKLKPYIKNAFLVEMEFQNRQIDFLIENGCLYKAIYENQTFKDIKHRKGPFTALCSFQYHKSGARIAFIRAINSISKEIQNS